MTLTGLHTNYSNGSYKADRNKEIKLSENDVLYGGGTDGLTPYYDGSIAIGYGFDLLAHDNAEINTYLAAAGLGSLSSADSVLLDKARAQRAAGTANEASLEAIRVQLTLNLGSEANASKILDKYIEERAEVDVDNFLASHGVSLGPSRERAALVSLAYNNPALLGAGLGKALEEEDRAEAWYEIRYKSNADKQHANRRYHEADMFGLYGSSSGEADYKAAYRMVTRHKVQVLQGYEGTFPPPSGTMALKDELATAANYLISKYGEGESIA